MLRKGSERSKIKRSSRKLPYTPSSIIRNALRRLWLRSRERSAALRREGYCCCQVCGVKNSKAKGREVLVEVHHACGHIRWDELESVIRLELLQSPEDLVCLCERCHDDVHK